MTKIDRFSLLFLFVTTFSIIAVENSALKILEEKEFKIREQQEPEVFRILKAIRLSGSSQFSKNSLEEIIKKIREHGDFPIAIIDLRQEMHLLGDGTSSQLIAEKDWSEINHKLEFITRDENALVQPGLIEREETIAQACGLQYVRIPVTDDSVPTHAEVDTFLNAYKEQIQNNPNTWFHVHCEHGHGRTTTFMALIHILATQGKEKLGDILRQEYACNDADLAFPPQEKVKDKDLDLQRKRFAFLEEFHQYVNDAEYGFFADKLWSEWKRRVDE